MMWCNPIAGGRSWQQSGRGWQFGPRAVETFLVGNNLALIVRAHEAVESRCEFLHLPTSEGVTLFSAPKSSGDCNNKSAVICIPSIMNVVFTSFDSGMSSESM
jgi:hypothetical protein